MNNIFDSSLKALLINSPDLKCQAVRDMSINFDIKNIQQQNTQAIQILKQPGRPQRPELISPQKLAKRSVSTEQGRIILMHAIAHIEFNAINLALDAIYRFRGMPDNYYSEWLKVAEDEARHFELVNTYLQHHGCCYGDYPAHNGLWDMAIKTQHDVLVRMALVPRVLEARGLDVTPAMISKLKTVGDDRAVDILTVIYQEEIHHVEIGSRWFKYCCAERELDHRIVFKELIAEYFSDKLRGPYNIEARLQAGFDMVELENLKSN